jgi:hypothetical protein
MNTPKHTTPRRLLAGVLFITAAAALGAEGVLAHRFAGKYKDQAAQGFAVYKDTAFLFQNTGYCRVYNLKTDRFVSEFALDTAAPENHANCASFGVEFPAGVHSYPAIYISECNGRSRCFVEEINEKGATLLQTLALATGGLEDRAFDWIVDRGQKCLYALALSPAPDPAKPKAEIQRVLVTKLPLPPLPPAAETAVVFKKSDILDQFLLTFPNLIQGGTVRNGFLYLPVGLHDAARGAKAIKSREILVVNLETKKIERRVDLNATVPDEPEDADFHGDTLLMFCGQGGGLYKINGI